MGLLGSFVRLITVAAILALAGLGYLIYDANLPSPLVPASEVAKDGGKLFQLRSGRMLEYFDSGPANSGPVLVMIHGGFQTGWVYQAIGLQERVRVISPTYPGLGASQSNNGRTFLSFGEDVRELLDHLQIKEFILGGVSFGGPHSAAVLAACMDRVSGWFLISPVVPVMFDFSGWTSRIKVPHLFFLLNYVMAIPKLNRLVAKHVFRPVFFQSYSENVWKELAGTDPQGSFAYRQPEFKKRWFLDMGRSIRYNLDGMADLFETSSHVKKHIDYPRLGKLMGSRPIHIHFGQNDTVVAPFCSAYMHHHLTAGGAKHVRGFPSHGPVPEGHFYTFSHVEEALDLMLEVLVMEKAGDEVGAFAAEDAAGKDSPLGDDGFEGVNDPQLEVPIQEEL